jgi:GNAT superfamily N-acetyltransferase
MVPVIGGALALVAISDLDTNHFGIRAARADDVTTDSLPHIVQFCRDERVRLLIARCNAANLPTARVMCSTGFDLMDTLVYANGPLDGPPPRSSGPTVLRSARPGDRAVVEAIARESFTNYFGHYHSDPRLDPIACTEVYVSWALRAFSGEAADATFIGEVDGRIAGFLSVRGGEHAMAPIAGVTASARGLGVYRTLVEEAVRWAMADGSRTISISTVVTNSVSLNTWLRVGLRTCGAAYTFHKWFDGGQ